MTECYFKIRRISEKEENERIAESVVTMNCSGNLTRLAIWRLNKFSSCYEELFEQLSNYDEKTVAEIILARGSANFEATKSDYKNEVICKSHQDELYFKWDNQKYKHIIFRKPSANESRIPSCSFPDGYGLDHGSSRPFVKRIFLSFEEGKAFLESEKILLHVGLPICAEHKKSLKKENDVKPKSENETKSNQYLSESTTPESSQSTEYKSNETKRPLSKPEPIVSPEVLDAFLNFAKVAGVSNAKSIEYFSKLAEDTQRKKADALKKITKISAQCMAPDNPEALLQKISTNLKKETKMSKQVDSLLNLVVDTYLSASSDRERNEILSQVAYAFPLNNLLEYFPNLTRNRYSNARKTASIRTLTKKPISIGHIKVRYSKQLVNLFIEFITSSAIMVDIPFGTQKIQFSSGLKTEIPNTIRRHRDNEICLMFDHYMEQTGRGNQKLSISTKKKILKICKASRRIALQCVDYYVAEGNEAFETLYSTLENFLKYGLIEESKKMEIKKLLKEAQHYLKTDYRINVKMNSRCADHCIIYALSDPINEKFSSRSCEELKQNSHKHDLKCERCMYFPEAICKIQNIINEKLSETKEEDEMFDKLCEFKEIVEKSQIIVENLKKHLLRAVFSDMERASIIQKLRDGEALVTMDYAQKWIPRKSDQQQREYYAQKGLSWHICHIFAMIDGVLKQHSITHLMGFEKQSAKTVITICRDVLTKLKSWNISHVSFRSDNASNYRNIELMVNLFAISAQLKIHLDRYSFSEVQNGKSSGDTECARLKRRMRDAMDSGKNIETPVDMFNALHFGTIPLHAMTVVVALVNGKDCSAKKSLNGISKISDFVFDYKNRKLRYWQYYNIGKGETIDIEDYKSLVLNAQLNISKQNENNPNSTNYLFWRPSHMATNEIENCRIQPPIEETEEEAEIDPEEDAPNPREGKIFFCPIAGCQNVYQYYGYLQRHLTIGKHTFVPDRCTLQDYALKAYQRQLEGAGAGRCLPELSEILENLGESENIKLEKGWAIRERAPRIKYSTDMKAFLDAEFESSQKIKQRINPKTVQEKMATFISNGKMRFKVAERLTSIQIGRYFASKLSKLREAENEKTNDDNEESEDDLFHDEPMFSDRFEALFDEIDDWSTIIPKGKENGEWSESDYESESEEKSRKKTPKKKTPTKKTPTSDPKKSPGTKKTPKKSPKESVQAATKTPSKRTRSPPRENDFGSSRSKKRK